MDMNTFGFTNDDAQFAAAIAFRELAVADGWSIRPTYGDAEPVERAASLNRDGYVMSVLARINEPGSKWKYQADVSLWGPDRLAIDPPKEYSMEAIIAGTTTCNYCHKTNVATSRVNFAGRCCAECLPEIRKSTEQPGWCD